MAKFLDKVSITGTVPKMLETTDSFIINAQVYDKVTLEPKKAQSVSVTSSHADIKMNTNTMTDIARNNFYDENNIIMDKYDSKYFYTVFVERNSALRMCKFKKEDDKLELVYQKYENNTNGFSASIISQDVGNIYVLYFDDAVTTGIAKIDKETFKVHKCAIGAECSRIRILKENSTYIYYAYSKSKDIFCIGKYDKYAASKTDIFYSESAINTNFYTYSDPIVNNENEVLAIRVKRAGDDPSTDRLVLKKYLIDYDFERVYESNIDLDCSILPSGKITNINDKKQWYHTSTLKTKNNEYFVLWNRLEKTFYLIKKLTDYSYSVIQSYQLGSSFNGVIPYNMGKTLIFYNYQNISFMSFKENEERFEISSTYMGYFTSMGIDRNGLVWVQHETGQVDMLGVEIPSSSEAIFVEQQIEYRNEDFETYIEVFCKNFDGNLVAANVDIILIGPVEFSDTRSQKKRIKTSKSSPTRIPVTITNSGFIEVISNII